MGIPVPVDDLPGLQESVAVPEWDLPDEAKMAAPAPPPVAPFPEALQPPPRPVPTLGPVSMDVTVPAKVPMITNLDGTNFTPPPKPDLDIFHPDKFRSGLPMTERVAMGQEAAVTKLAQELAPRPPRPGIVAGPNTVLGTMLDESGKEGYQPFGETMREAMRKPLVDVAQYIPDDMPITKGVAEALQGFGSPENLALMGGAGYFSKFANGNMGRLISAGFTADMTRGVIESHEAMRQAAESGDFNTVDRILGSLFVTLPMIGSAGKHALVQNKIVKVADLPEVKEAVARIQSDLSKAAFAEHQKGFLPDFGKPGEKKVVEEKPGEPVPVEDIPDTEIQPGAEIPPVVVDRTKEAAPVQEAKPEIVEPTETSPVVARNLPGLEPEKPTVPEMAKPIERDRGTLFEPTPEKPSIQVEEPSTQVETKPAEPLAPEIPRYPVTGELVKEVYPRATVEEVDPGESWRVSHPNKPTVIIRNTGSIEIDPVAFERDYHRPLSALDIAAGDTSRLGPDVIVRIASIDPNVKRELLHEQYHVAELIALDETQIGKLRQKYGDVENTAEAYRKYAGDGSSMGFELIRFYFNRLAGKLGAKLDLNTGLATFEKIRTGEAFAPKRAVEGKVLDIPVETADSSTQEGAGEGPKPVAERLESGTPASAFSAVTEAKRGFGAETVHPNGNVNAAETLTQYSIRRLDDRIEAMRRNAGLRKLYTQKQLEDFYDGMKMTQKIFGDFSMLPKEEKGNPIRENEDPLFKFTFDATTICPQQDQYVAIIRAIEKELTRTLNPTQRFKIGLMMQDAGTKASCWYCYGQAARDLYESNANKAIGILEKGSALFRANGGKVSPAELEPLFGTWNVINERGNPSNMYKALLSHWQDIQKGELRPDRARDLALGLAEPQTDFEKSLTPLIRGTLQGTTQANVAKPWAEYIDQILRVPQDKWDQAMAAAGARLNSQSDFRIWHTLELAQVLAHIAQRDGMAHVYLRQPDMIRIFGKTGIKFNMSVEYARDPEGNLMRNTDGSLMFNMNGFPQAEALRLRKANPDCGTMLVARNMEEVLAGLNDPNIDMIIPYHRGRVALEVEAFNKATDFSGQQHEIYLNKRAANGRELKWDGPPITRKQHGGNKQQYLNYVAKLGLRPRFNDFVDHPNYMKLVKDIAAGQMDQRRVDPTKINWDEAARLTDLWVKKEGELRAGDQRLLEANQALLTIVWDRIRNNDWPQEGTHYSIRRQEETPEFKRWFGGSKVVDQEGKPIVVYHGSSRPDRIGSRFQKNRATSGPSAFFTEETDIASSYAGNKADTSLGMPDSYDGWYKTRIPGSPKEVNVSNAWLYASPEQRAAATKKLYEIGYANVDEASGEIVSGSRSIMDRSGIDYELKDARGNAIKAAENIWLNSGELLNTEETFLDVLREMGFNKVRFDSPNRTQPGVLPVYLKIENPLDTSRIPEKVIDELHSSALRQRKYPNEYGVDPWDKRSRSAGVWLQALMDDYKHGTTHAWTSIPDWVTRTLKRLGFDGIRDTGGKLGDAEHNVWIPFEPTQIKSATGNVGTFDPTNPDIRYSVRQKPTVQPLPKEEVTRPPVKERARAAWNKTIRSHYDQFRPIQQLVQEREIEKVRGQTPEGRRLAEITMLPSEEAAGEAAELRKKTESFVYKARTAMAGKKAAREKDVVEDPYKIFRIAEGGGSGAAVPHVHDLKKIMDEARAEGLGDRLLEELRWVGYGKAWDIVESKMKSRKETMRELRKDLGLLGSQIKGLENDLRQFEGASVETKVDFDVSQRNRLKLQALKDLQAEKKRQLSQASQEATRYEAEIINKRVVGKGIGRQEIEKMRGDFEALGTPGERARLAEYKKRVYELNRKILNAMHDEGLINDRYYESLVEHGEDYVPNYRLVEELDTGEAPVSLGMQAKRPIKGLEGGPQMTMDPVMASMLYGENGIKQIWRNRATRALVQWIGGEGRGIIEMKQLNENERPPEGKGVISYYEGGKIQRFAVDQLIADTVSLVRPEPGLFMKMLNGFGSVARKGMTTANLAFAVPNVIRDVKDAASLGKAGAGVFKNWLNSLKQSLDDPEVRAYYESGAAYSNMQAQISPRSAKDLRRRGPIKVLEDLNNIMEQATKLSTFKTLRRQGKTDLQAAWETRNFGGSPDFARKGVYSSIWNVVFMFSNARLQGAGRTLGGLARDPKRMGALFAGYAAAQAALQSWNSQFQSPEEDGTREWDHVTENDKKNYIVFLTPYVRQMADGSLRLWSVKMPKGYTEQVILNPIQDAFSAAWGHDFDPVQSAITLGENLLPFNMNLERGTMLKRRGNYLKGDIAAGITSSLNPILKETYEQGMNFDSFRKAPIVPESQSRLSPELQIGQKTSVTAKLAGDFAGWSPTRVEHAIKGFTGGLGEQALSVSDRILGKEGRGIPVLDPIIRRFVDIHGTGMDQVYKNKLEEFYDLRDRATEVNNSFNAYSNKSEAEASAYLARGENERLLELSGVLDGVSESLKALRMEMQATADRKDLSEEEKRRLLRDNYKQQIEALNSVLQ